MTERLYFDDPYRTQFHAAVIARNEQNGQPAVALDRSAFYPEGGGQPADTGTLNGIVVRDVQASDTDDLVWHILSTVLEADTVHGIVDWPRRFDHMQQHHGQHLLSAAAERLFGFKTVAFHLGVLSATIDLDTPTLTVEQAAEIEELANDVIWEDRPILARFVTPVELATITLRKPPTVSGAIRVVSVPEFDHSACGGTHPRSTGSVGLLHIRRWERRGNTTRLEFLCGGRALRDLRYKNQVLARTAGRLSVAAEALEDAVTRLQEAEAQQRKRLELARTHLLAYEAAELAAAAEHVGSLLIVRRVFLDRTLEEIRTLAQQLAGRGCVALFGLHAAKAQIIFTCGPSSTVDCAALLRTALAPFGGRGGGNALQAQGGVPDASMLDAVLDAAIGGLTG